MRLLRWNSWCAIVAFLITLVFIVRPGPYEMALFTFVAQPLFAITAASYMIEVFREFRRRRVL